MVRLKKVSDSKSWLNGDLFFDAKGFLRFPKAFDYIDKSKCADDAFSDLDYFEDCLFLDDLVWTKEAKSALQEATSDFEDFIAFKDIDGVRYMVKNTDKSLDAFADYAQDKYGMACLGANFKEEALSSESKFVGFSVWGDDSEVEEFVHCSDIPGMAMILFQGYLLKDADIYFSKKGRQSDSERVQDWNVLDSEHLPALKRWLQRTVEDLDNIDADALLRWCDLLGCEYEDTVNVDWDLFEKMTRNIFTLYQCVRGEADFKYAETYCRRALDLLDKMGIK